jgi:ammonia channel protein AmtB
MGCNCDLITNPVFAIAIGALIGFISTIGFLKINPYLKEKISLSDTCGVHYLHGIPSIVGWLISIIAASYLNVNDIRNSPEFKFNKQYLLFNDITKTASD